MFLTQEHSSSFMSLTGDSGKEIDGEYTLQQNVAVFQEIENVLEDYPVHPYQDAFSIAELRQQLVNHVLRHLPKRDSVMGDVQQSSTDAQLPYRLKQERIRLDALIRGSILHLLRENADWVSRQLQNMDSSGNQRWETLP
jgi:hypothetical protein